MSTTRRPGSWLMQTARLKARVVLPTPPLGAYTVIVREAPVVRLLVASFWTA